MKRKDGSEQLTVRLSEEEARRLEEAAKAGHRTKSAQLRYWLELGREAERQGA